MSIEELLLRPLTPIDAEAADALETGPIDPTSALAADDVDGLLDASPLPVECGYCFMDDGVGYVAMRVAMPGVTGEMIDWWFDWHADDPLRYRVWHPRAHVSNSVQRPATAGGRPHWGATHFPVEDVGLGVQHLRIDFEAPEQLGFSPGALERPGVAAIVGGRAGDMRKRARHTKMVHVWLREPEGGGTFLRSRFWIGLGIRPYLPTAAAAPIGWLIDRPAGRRLLIPRAAPLVLARHCAEEYTHLAAILPELYARYGS